MYMCVHAHDNAHVPVHLIPSTRVHNESGQIQMPEKSQQKIIGSCCLTSHEIAG